MKKLFSILLIFFFSLSAYSQIVPMNNNSHSYFDIYDMDDDFVMFMMFMSSYVYSEMNAATPTIKVYRMDSINTTIINEWVDVKFDTVIDEETFSGYFNFNEDSTGIILDEYGLFYVSGSAFSKWNGGAGSGSGAVRIMVNDVEQRCLQSSRTRSNQTGDYDAMNFVGSAFLDGPDTVKVQYRVTSADLDWEGNTIFDFPISFGINMFMTNMDAIGDFW